jgi:hypothetical protein
MKNFPPEGKENQSRKCEMLTARAALKRILYYQAEGQNGVKHFRLNSC